MNIRLALGVALGCAAALAHAQEAGPAPASEVLAYGGRVVPPMNPPQLPGKDWDGVKPVPAKPAPQWDRALPFFAQRVIDQGIELPNPYDIGLSMYLSREDRKLSSLQVGFNGAPLQELGFVQFPNSHIENQSAQLQVGAWVFPFLNAYGIVGYTQGKGNIDITIDGRGLMQFLGVPGCNLPIPPALCSQVLAGTAHADYDGYTYGLGVTAAGAHGNLFFALPITYVLSDITMSDTLGRTWNVAPRVGWNQHLGGGGILTWYAGGTWLKSDVNITGTAFFDTAGTALGQLTSMSYKIHVEPKDRWNYLAGANWTINRSWGLAAEVGFGGSRQDLLFNAFWRF